MHINWNLLGFFITGVHQDHLANGLGHKTAFPPEMAGREWTIALNRHSSKKTVASVLKKRDGKDPSQDMIDAIYSLIGYSVDQVKEDEVWKTMGALEEAYDSLVRSEVIICPTTVGYTLIATDGGVKKMKAIKGREEKKACGILGVPEVYRDVFGAEPPLAAGRQRHICGFLGKPTTIKEYIPRASLGSKGEVGIWLDNGPVVTYLACRLWKEQKEVIVATSCNIAGEGNATGDRYSLDRLNSMIREKVDLQVEIPHWETPQTDSDGRWLSAPIFNLEEKKFLRRGRDQELVEDKLK